MTRIFTDECGEAANPWAYFILAVFRIICENSI